MTNGIPVYTINAGFQDLVRIEWLFRLRSFDPQRPLLQNAANRLLQEGTSKKSAQEIADQIDYFGAFLETEEGPDTVSIVLYTLNKHLPKMLPIVRELFADAVYPEHELGIYKQNQVQRLTVENEKFSHSPVAAFYSSCSGKSTSIWILRFSRTLSAA